MGSTMTTTKTVLLALCVLLGAGCFGRKTSTGPDPKTSRFIYHLRIDSITIYAQSEGLFSGLPEIEVYLVDAVTGTPLGCSGARHGLNHVDDPRHRYSGLHAPFENTEGQYLWGNAHNGKLVQVKMSEDDDDAPCPSALPSPGDDGLGEAGPIRWEDLFGARVESPDRFIIEFEPVGGSPGTDGGVSDAALPAMRFAWAAAAGGSGADTGSAIGVDSAGNSYIAGNFATTAAFGSTTLTGGEHELFVAKLDPTGEHLWATSIPRGSGNPRIDVAADSAGNSYLTGSFGNTATFGSTELTSEGMIDAFVAKLDPAGNPLWAKAIGGGGDMDYGEAIVVDSGGNSYVTGLFTGAMSLGASLSAAGGHDVFVAKLDPTGQVVWGTSVGGGADEGVVGIAVDGGGNSYITGTFAGTATFGSVALTAAGEQDVFVAKLDPAGKVVWASRAGEASNDWVAGIGVDGAGNSYITGGFRGTSAFGQKALTSVKDDDVYVAKLDPTGAFVWATRAGGQGSDGGTDIAVDSAGNSTVTGGFSGLAGFGAGHLTSSGDSDAFVARLDKDGTFLWAVAAGGAAADVGRGIAVDSAGNSHLTGTFSETAAFGGSTVTSQGDVDIFTARLTP
jgi:hypothetical protein